MPKYTAEEAAEISRKNMSEVIVRPLIDQIDKRMEEVMEQGNRIIYHPFSKLKDAEGRSYYPTLVEQKAILYEYEKAEYKVVHHPDPDPGHPASGDYYTIEW